MRAPRPTKKPVAVYLRVSSDDQSHDSQRAEVDRWLAREGIDPAKVEWYEDVETGRTIRRPEMDQLQIQVAGRHHSLVVVYALDRLSRDFFDGVTLLGQWLKLGVRVASVTEAIDLSGEIGQAIAGVIFALAAAEWRKRKERQRAGIDLAKGKGTYTGRKPGTLKADPARAAELHAKGLTYREIATAMGVTKRTVLRYLRSSANQSGGRSIAP